MPEVHALGVYRVVLAEQEPNHQQLVHSVPLLLRGVGEALLTVEHAVDRRLVVEHLHLVQSDFFRDGSQVLLVKVHAVTKPFYCSLKLFVVDFVETKMALFGINEIFKFRSPRNS